MRKISAPNSKNKVDPQVYIYRTFSVYYKCS